MRWQRPAAMAHACTVAVPVPADPGQYGVQAQYAGAFANVCLYKRAQAAAQLGKPWILEEVGAVSDSQLKTHSPRLQPMLCKHPRTVYP